MKRRGRGQPKIYKWDEWLAARRFNLQRGRDYFCRQSTMAQQIRSAASVRSVSVSIIDEDNGFIVLIRGRNGKGGSHAKAG